MPWAQVDQEQEAIFKIKSKVLNANNIKEMIRTCQKNLGCFVCLVLLLGITACAQSSTEEPQSSGKEKITFVLDWVPNTNHTGVYVAQELGYFDEAGLGVEVIQPPEGGALPLVAAGKAEFCVSFQEEIAAALTSNSPLDVVAVGTILQHNTSGIISYNIIFSPKDMEGKVYAMIL